MKDMTRWSKALTLGVLLTLFLGAPTLHAASDAAAEMAPAEVTESGVPAPEQGCDLPAEAPRLEVQPPEATPTSGSSGTFYVCLNQDFFCGSCPSGTRCATEACGSTFNPQCTFRTACVTSCVITNCTAIVNNCFDF